ncbi:MAG TPA: hypothetical protein VK465_16475, partial [Fibrobacteria bacterium]|nr:hypothetical protein [Fibrobacteria bacterium]
MPHLIAPRDSLFHFVRLSIGFVLLVLLAVVSEPLAAKKSAPNPGTKSKAPAVAETTMPTKPPAGLDTTLVRGYYLDGDFDPAIDILETHLTLHRVQTHEDSVFAFKHLGVMHAAKYETREKGKHYMLKLLETEPTARILAMYASDMIYMIFKNIQDEYLASRRKFEHADMTLAQKPREDRPAEEKPV